MDWILVFIVGGVAMWAISSVVLNETANSRVEKTFCNADYCINATPGNFESCNLEGYSSMGGGFIGYYSSDPVVVERCREIWKFLEDSRGDGSD